MRKILGLLALVMVCTVLTASAAGWQEHTVLKGEMSLQTPENFSFMPFHLRPMPYPGIERPVDILSDPSGRVTLSFNHTRAKVQDDVKVIRKSMSGVFHKSYPDARWLKDSVETINGCQYAVFEYISNEHGESIHSIILASNLRGRLLLIVFRMPESEASQWLKTGYAMISSILAR